MQPRWQSPCSNNQGINLDNLFNTPHLDVIKLLNVDNIVDEVKRQNDKFTQKLIANPQILHELIQICLRPTHFKHQQVQQVTNVHTYKALEILTNLTEDFPEYLIQGEVNKYHRNSQSENDDVVTQQIQQYPMEWNKLPIVVHVFRLLNDPKPIEETPLWYMHKISTSICYQKPKHTMRLFANKDLCMLVFQHFYSYSILEWLVKLIEMEDSTTFFQKEKVELFKNFIGSLKKQKNVQIKIAKYENYESILTTMLQKMQDRFDKSKYTNLAKLIFTQKYPIQFILDEVEHYTNKRSAQQQTSAAPSPQEQQLFNISLLILQKYLHFSSLYRTNLASNNNNNNSSLNTSNNKGNNLGAGMFSGAGGSVVLDTSVYAEIVLDADAVKRIWAIAATHAKSCGPLEGQKHESDDKTKQSLSITLSFLKLVKALLMSLQTLDHEYVHTFMTQNYVKYLLGLLTKHKNCNILHNLVRDILIEAINLNYQEFVPVLMGNSNASTTGFVQLVSEMKTKINSGENQYENQLYHIFQTILKKCGEDHVNSKTIETIKTHVKGFEQLQGKIKDKERMYNTQISGNPRKQSSCWGDSSQDQKMFQFNFTNTQNARDSKEDEQIPESPTVNDNIETNQRHWYDCGGLPLDSDQSKDSGFLQTSQPLEKDDEVGIYYKTGQTKKKQTSKNQEQQWSANQIENQLVKKFKNFGVVECQQQQIRIPARKNRYSDSKKKKTDVNAETTNQKYQQKIKDSSELELEREIKILQAKRMHNVGSLQQDRSPEIKIRVKKKVDSIQQEQQNNENYYPEGETLLVKSVDSVQATETLTHSKDKNKDNGKQKKDTQSEKVIPFRGSENQKNSKQNHSKLHISSLQINQINEQSYNLNMQRHKSDLQIKSPSNERGSLSPRSPRSPRPKTKSQNQINSANSNGSKEALYNPFPKYLTFQIEQILAQLE